MSVKKHRLRFNKADFLLCDIPLRERYCYLYKEGEKTLLTFNQDYAISISENHPEIQLKKLQQGARLYVPFYKKRIIDAKKQIFELYKPKE